MASEMEARARVWTGGTCDCSEPTYCAHDLAAFAEEEVARALEKACDEMPSVMTLKAELSGPHAWLRARAVAIRTGETGGAG